VDVCDLNKIFLSSARLFRAVCGPMVWLVDSSLIVSRDSHENRALEHENWKKKTEKANTL